MKSLELEGYYNYFKIKLRKKTYGSRTKRGLYEQQKPDHEYMGYFFMIIVCFWMFVSFQVGCV